MATYDRTCAGCGEPFTAKSPRAKWCTPVCRMRTKRAGATPAEVEPDPTIDPEILDRHELVVTTRRELTAAGVVDTFHGQVALQLARRLAQPDESGVSSLSRELDRVMTAALGARTVPAAESTDEAEPVPTELTRAREARERKARAAAGRA